MPMLSWWVARIVVALKEVAQMELTVRRLKEALMMFEKCCGLVLDLWLAAFAQQTAQKGMVVPACGCCYKLLEILNSFVRTPLHHCRWLRRHSFFCLVRDGNRMVLPAQGENLLLEI